MVDLVITNNGLPMHLGGHENETHIDEGALQFLINKFGIKSMIDVGCGPGGMVKTAMDAGLSVQGVDGDFTVERVDEVRPVIEIHDYSKGIREDSETYDLAWSVEFLEHVDPEYIYNFMHDFRKCKYVVCTHALPGQPGHHHVNCQDTPYWVAIFRAFGFEIDEQTTNEVRQASTMKERYMRQQSLFFRNMNRA